MAKTIPKDISNALVKTFEHDGDSHSRIIVFLCQSLHAGFANNTEEPYINALQNVISIPDVFTRVAKKLVEDTKKAENDPKYRQFMYDIWSSFMKEDLSENTDNHQKLALVAYNKDAVIVSAQWSFMHALANLPPRCDVAIRQAVKSVATAGPLAVYGNKALSQAIKAAPLVKVALLVAHLAWDILKNISRWWKGEITGVRCVKNIIDNGVSVAAGIAGGVGGEVVGAAIGGIFGPVGMGVGAVVGAVFVSVAAATGAQVLCDRLTQWFFGIPKSEAVENAYIFLGMPIKASNGEINSRYRQLARNFHPDKGGDAEKWTKLQYSMAIIREARGEHY